METFTITDAHVRLLNRSYIGWDKCEYGAPAIDCKRPYGNGDVALDIAEILGWDIDEDEGLTQQQHDAARAVHEQMRDVLQILVRTAPEPLRLGAYERESKWGVWKWAES